MKKVVLFTDDKGNKEEYTTPEQIKTLTTDDIKASHGSHTSATAAGSEVGNGLQGVAPEADIVLVGKKTSVESNMAEGMRIITDYANSVGKPCVISMSMGILDDLHDGSSLVCKAVEQLTEKGTKPGVAIVMSSGNAANSKAAIVKKLDEADSNGWQLKTIMGVHKIQEFAGGYRVPTYTNGSFIIYSDDGKDFEATIKMVNIKTGEIIDNTMEHCYYIDDDTEKEVTVDVKLYKNTQYPSNRHGKCVTYKIEWGEILLRNPDHRLGVFVKGTKGQTIKMIEDIRDYAEPEFFVPKDLEGKGYTSGGPDFACNSTICSDAVISVGSYISRNSYPYYKSDGKDYVLRESAVTHRIPQIGEISDFSSWCVDDLGKAHPTLLGPGQEVMSAYNCYDQTYFNPVSVVIAEQDKPNVDLCTDDKLIKKDGRTYWYGIMGGTSMSTPHVAGVLALWMQAKPQLTVNEIKEVMAATCDRDKWITDIDLIPSKRLEQAGYGKINALAGVKKILGITGIQAVPADAQGDAAPAYNLMGQKVSRSAKGVVIYKGKKYMNL